MEVTRLRVGPMVTNCYVVKEGCAAMIIDPGYSAEKIEAALKGACVKYIILTHAHFDHIYESGFFRSKYGAKVVILDREEASLYDPDMFLSTEGYDLRTYRADMTVSDGDIFDFEGCEFRIIHTPGHTRGSMCLYCEKEKILFSGDTLFNGSVGRMDFPGGSEESMRKSVEKLMTLPDDVTVHPGHGFSTTVGAERQFNPFIGRSI